MNIWNDYKGKGILALVLFILLVILFFIGWKMDTHSKLLLKRGWLIPIFLLIKDIISSPFSLKSRCSKATWFRHPFLYYFIQQFMWMLETVKVGNIVHGIIFIQTFLSALSVVMIYTLCCKICKNTIVSFY